ncbi:MAG: PAS domain-containing protein [candidate division NC10 bacterium]|nr:PAS domain-containing protein [candidate division NC10 bacterium]
MGQKTLAADNDRSYMELFKELHALRRHQEVLLETMGEGVVEADQEGTIVSVNHAALEIFERPKWELVGRPLVSLFREGSRLHLGAILAQLQRGRTPQGTATLSHGERILQLHFTRIGEDWETSGFFMIIQDITALARRIQELSTWNGRLMRLDQLKSDFLGMLSHDLHTPLTAIKGSLDVVLEEEISPELKEELLTIARENTERLFRMLSNILDLVRIEAGRLEVLKEPFDLPLALREAMERLRPMAVKKSLSFNLTLHGPIPLLPADPIRMGQVFVNLFSNAIKFTPPGGVITVEALDRSREVEVIVADSGIGIPQEHLSRVFEKFYRIPIEGERIEGTGLGLAICKAIVEEHGGRIWVKSQIGAGSRFYFTLPKDSGATVRG